MVRARRSEALYEVADGSQIVTTSARNASSTECDICHRANALVIRVRATGERVRPTA
jgi:hypothetical protein